MPQQDTVRLTSKQYEKLSDWGGRFALVGLGSLVIQQLVNGVPIANPSVVLGAIITALAYSVAYICLKRSVT